MGIFTSLLTAGANSHQETSENANAMATDFASNGVVGALSNTAGVAPATGGFAVNAQASPNMTVAVSSGVAYVAATPSSQNNQRLRIRNTTSLNVTVSSNASGSTKYDWLYLSVDAATAANPAVAADDVSSLVISRSSSSTVDNGTPPTYGLLLGVITVANAAINITNGNITDSRVNTAVTSIVVQIVTTDFGAVATGTTIIPYDDTIPQITEGTEFMTQTITPKSATNRLFIEFEAYITNSVVNETVGALFQGTTTGALAAKVVYGSSATGEVTLRVTHDMVAGTTSATTFRFRAGPSGAATLTFNGRSGSHKFGGITLSTVKITEYKA